MSRFSELSAKLAAKGAHDPDALAAYIGRKKYGREGMATLAAAGRNKHGRSAPIALGDGAALHGDVEPPHIDTPAVGAVTDEPDASGAHSGPVLTRAQARARLMRRGLLL